MTLSGTVLMEEGVLTGQNEALLATERLQLCTTQMAVISQFWKNSDSISAVMTSICPRIENGATVSTSGAKKYTYKPDSLILSC